MRTWLQVLKEGRVAGMNHWRTHTSSEIGLRTSELIETLEARTLLSVTLDSGVLTITGSDAADDYTISITADGTVDVAGDADGEDGTFAEVSGIVFDAGGDDDSLTIEGDDDEGDRFDIRQGKKDDEGAVIVSRKNLESVRLTINNLEELTVDGEGGDDRIVLKKVSDTDLAVDGITLRGGEGDDRIKAAKAGMGVTIRGGEGNDKIVGSRENDTLRGGDGQDIIKGNRGEDDIRGGEGGDRLFGGNGNDILRGGEGVDRISGGKGRDTVDYSSSEDIVILSLRLKRATQDGFGTIDRKVKGIENIIGSSFPDRLEGDRHDNNIDGGAGGDIIDGLDGDDVINAGLIVDPDDPSELIFDGDADEIDGGLGDTTFIGCGLEDTCIGIDDTTP